MSALYRHRQNFHRFDEARYL